MKKLYTLLSVVVLAFSANAQTPIITGIMDGDCSGGNPKVLEIYASGTVNFADYSIENQTNANTAWGQTLNLASFGTVTNDFVYIVHDVANLATFNAEFSGIPAANILAYPTGSGTPQPLNINGDDRVRLIDAATMAVIDQFGTSDADGTGLDWEYLDSWAKRNNGAGPNATFTSSEWTYGGVEGTVGALEGLGTCQGAAAFSTVVPFGDYTLGVKQNSIQGLKVYPNPVVDGKLYINTDANSSKEVVIYDVLGKQVLKATTNNAVNVSNLNGGVYIVKITEEGKTATRKLVIK